ncbi:hypothetical protein IMCC26134_06130 [Verrucomicrobia bacterium IMCC26134]|nr:hypothetical protein IMCC26134_06130 [Verrucomicrobia bacterium IMCC26134]
MRSIRAETVPLILYDYDIAANRDTLLTHSLHQPGAPRDFTSAIRLNLVKVGRRHSAAQLPFLVKEVVIENIHRPDRLANPVSALESAR